MRNGECGLGRDFEYVVVRNRKAKEEQRLWGEIDFGQSVIAKKKKFKIVYLTKKG